MKLQVSILTTFILGCQAWSSIPDRRRFTGLEAVSGNSNVVLQPSTKEDAFDNLKVGTARVHRYVRDDDEGSEYVMWYHGRGTNFDPENKLPPLTTGRIGRATSRNGLHWKRTEEGSASEDAPGVSLGLNAESWWGFDTSHVGLGQVLLPMSTPAVMTEGGVYLMYYMGGSFEETPIGNYIEKEIPGAGGAKIQGMNMKIGVALSQDGVSFGRVEGDDPSGAIMAPYDSADPNMAWMKSMRDDDKSLLNLKEELYCGWPEVTYNDVPEDERESALSKQNFFMYYSTMLKETKRKVISCAVSEDGFRWEKRGICVQPEANGLDAGGCARCTVVRKATYNSSTSTWESTKGWIMLYEGVSAEDGKHRILAAESDDLRNWKKTGIALEVGENNDSWDCDGVGAPHLIRLDDGTTRMYYTGQGNDGSTAIGVAKSDNEDSRTWIREQAQLTFSVE